MNNPTHSEEIETSHRYTTFIKYASWTGGAITALICIVAFFVLMANGDNSDVAGQIGRSRERSPATGLILMPVGGYVLGMALAVLFAPTSYLMSKEGKQWMDKVGVKNVGSARVVSLIFVIFGIAFLTFFTLAILTDNFKKPLL